MASYARKPQTIEAHQWNGDLTAKMPEWLYDAIMEGNKIVMKGKNVFINSEYGEQMYLVNDGDYIVQERDGNISTRHPAVFESDYYLL